jgi:membrane-bound serine protease (ClpP class)
MSEELIEERQRNLIDKMSMKIREQAPISKRGERLTLTAAEAREAGLAQLVVVTSFDDEGGREEVLGGLKIPVGRGDVIDQYRGTTAARSESEKAILDFLNHPVTRFILLLCAFLGLVIEFKMPGTFIPIACSAACFLIFFLAGSFPAPAVTGVNEKTTSVFEIVLFIIGSGLVVTELFLLPGVLIFGLLGIVLMLVSLVLAMVPPAGLIDDSTMGFRGALNILMLALGTGFGAFFLVLKLVPRSSFFNRSGLITNAAIVGVPNADSIVEAQERNAMLLGKIGVAITPLRPAGKIDVGGQVLDVVAEGDFVEKGERVEIIDASVFRAVVKRRA